MWTDAAMSNRQQNEAHSAGVSETTLQQKALYQPTGPSNLLRMQYVLTTLLRAQAALLGQRTAAGRGGERSREPFTELRPFRSQARGATLQELKIEIRWLDSRVVMEDLPTL